MAKPLANASRTAASSACAREGAREGAQFLEQRVAPWEVALRLGTEERVALALGELFADRGVVRPGVILGFVSEDQRVTA